jgi:hypothetical protein
LLPFAAWGARRSFSQVRALVRRKDDRADALRRLGAEVMQGHLTDLASMRRPGLGISTTIPFLGLFQPFFPLVFALDLSRLE